MVIPSTTHGNNISHKYPSLSGYTICHSGNNICQKQISSLSGLTICHNGYNTFHKSLKLDLIVNQQVVLTSTTLLSKGNNICHGIGSTSAITFCCYIQHSIGAKIILFGNIIFHSFKFRQYTTSNIYHNILVQIQNSKILRQTFAHTHLLVNVYKD